MSERMKQMKNNVLLVLTALIWGCSFVAQSVGMDYVGPFTFNAVRCLIGAAVLIPVILFMDKSARKSGIPAFSAVARSTSESPT